MTSRKIGKAPFRIQNELQEMWAIRKLENCRSMSERKYFMYLITEWRNRDAKTKAVSDPNNYR